MKLSRSLRTTGSTNSEKQEILAEVYKVIIILKISLKRKIELIFTLNWATEKYHKGKSNIDLALLEGKNIHNQFNFIRLK